MIKTVSTHTTGIEAHIVRCRLEYEGIPAFVAFEHHIWAMWTHSVALGGVRVQVPSSHFDSAQTIVSNISTGVYESELNMDEQIPDKSICPSCNSEVIMDINWPWKTALAVLFILSMPFPYTRHMKKCSVCSHRWIAHEQRGYPLYVIFILLIIIAATLITAGELWCHWCRLHCEYSYVFKPQKALLW